MTLIPLWYAIDHEKKIFHLQFVICIFTIEPIIILQYSFDLQCFICAYKTCITLCLNWKPHTLIFSCGFKSQFFFCSWQWTKEKKNLLFEKWWSTWAIKTTHHSKQPVKSLLTSTKKEDDERAMAIQMQLNEKFLT